MVATTSGRGETRAQTLLRLARKGIAEGLCPEVWEDDAGVWFVVRSSRDPYECYSVEPGADEGCTCPGWASHGYCKHYALAVSLFGVFTCRMRPARPAAAPLTLSAERDALADALDLPVCWGCGAESTVDDTGICEACHDHARLIAGLPDELPGPWADTSIAFVRRRAAV